MKANDWLRAATKKLSAAGIGTARLDALVLLEDALGIDRARILAQPDLELPAASEQQLKKLLRRRVEHEPLAYVRGKTEFFAREFMVTPAVLEPRPESETMIELLLELKKSASAGGSAAASDVQWDGKVRIADVGTGSGALGITAQLELPEASVELLELDDAAIDVAKMNVVKHTISINVIKSNLLAQSPQDYDILLCNLPYVPDDYHINAAAGHEPALAIFGGADGLDIYRQLFAQIKIVEKKPLYILTEALPPQHQALTVIAQAAGYQLQTARDFIQLFKYENATPR